MKGRLRHLPSGLLASAVLLVVGVVRGGLLRGGAGAAGAAAGVLLVAASYTVSSLAIAWADSVHPRLVMSVGLTTYYTWSDGRIGVPQPFVDSATVP